MAKVKCPVCGKEFKGQGGLDWHKKRAHAGPSRKPGKSASSRKPAKSRKASPGTPATGEMAVVFQPPESQEKPDAFDVLRRGKLLHAAQRALDDNDLPRAEKYLREYQRFGGKS